MLTAPLSFPENIPDGYVELPETQVFDAGKHLQLEFPDQIWSLEDFGYSPEDIAKCASDVAVTSPFRLLSNLGVEDLYQVTVNLQDHQTNAKGARNPAHLAGGGYRSKFQGIWSFIVRQDYKSLRSGLLSCRAWFQMMFPTLTLQRNMI